MAGHSATAVAAYIVERRRTVSADTLTPMQVLKLVYLSHAYYLGAYSQPLITEQVEAWKYGPVVRSVYEAVKSYGSLPVETVRAPREEFTPNESGIINAITDYYGAFSGPRLSTMTHEPDSPWDLTWRQHGQSAVISNDLIEDHYNRLIRTAREKASVAA